MLVGRGTGGYVGPSFPVTRQLRVKPLHPDGNERDSLIWELTGAYNGAARVRKHFAERRIEIDEKLASGELGVVGHRKALAALAAELKGEIEKYRRWVTRGKERIDELTAHLTTREHKPSKDFDEAIERGLRKDRLIRRLEALPSDQQRAAIRRALDARDLDVLETLYGESGLLDPEHAFRAKLVLMQSRDKIAFNELEELAGKFDYAGRIDPIAPGCVPVVGLTLDLATEWMDKAAGIEPPDPRARLGAAAAAKEGSANGGELPGGSNGNGGSA
jgi:hypothetical protein